MPTAKKRINLTVGDGVLASLRKIAKQENASVASVSYALLERALELHEDQYFSKVGERRLSKNEKRIGHDEFWK